MSSKSITWEDIIETKGMLEAQMAMIELALSESKMSEVKQSNYRKLYNVLNRAHRDITVLSEKHRSLSFLYSEKMRMYEHKSVIISDLVSL